MRGSSNRAERAYNRILDLLTRNISRVMLEVMEQAEWIPEMVLELLQKMADDMVSGFENVAEIMADKFANEQKKETDKAFVKSIPGFKTRDLVDNENIRKEMMDSIRHNVSLITSIPPTMAGDMSQYIKNLMIDGTLTDETPIDVIQGMLKKGLFDDDAKARRRSRLIARDQSSKLNSNITSARFQQHGIRYYRWRAQGGRSGDGRTRTEHKARHGLVFSVAAVSGKSVVRVNGRRLKIHGVNEDISGNATKADLGNPGEGIQCRCGMDPIIENV